MTTNFQGKRVSHEYVQVNHAIPEQVFPLLCPVREAEWVPGWRYRMIYSQSGVAELGCIFATPNEDGPDTIWVVTKHDPASHRVEFVWVWPGKVTAQIRIQLSVDGNNSTKAHIAYIYTALSAAGNAEIERYTSEWFQQKMRGWEAAINYYLREGKKLSEAGWE